MRLKNKLLIWIFSLFFIPLLVFFVLAVSGTYSRYKSNYSLIKEESITRLQENYYEKINNIENDAGGFIESIKSGTSAEAVNEKIDFILDEHERISRKQGSLCMALGKGFLVIAILCGVATFCVSGLYLKSLCLSVACCCGVFSRIFNYYSVPEE